MSNAPQIRNLSFELGPHIPRFWHGAGRSITLFFNNLSILFPAGERFFIASVKAHSALVSDANLAACVRGFSAQEGIHSREHARYNEMLAAQGFPIEKMERAVKRILGAAKWVLSSRGQLAATCALEHLTALLGHFVLKDPRILERAHPTMAALWQWHAAEELEHKAVAYDVYQTARGGYLRRATLMLLASSIFWSWVFIQQLRLMRQDGIMLDRKEWAALVRFLFIEPGGMWPLLRLTLSYYRPDFHPRQIDSEALLAGWLEAQPQTTGLSLVR